MSFDFSFNVQSVEVDSIRCAVWCMQFGVHLEYIQCLHVCLSILLGDSLCLLHIILVNERSAFQSQQFRRKTLLNRIKALHRTKSSQNDFRILNIPQAMYYIYTHVFNSNSERTIRISYINIKNVYLNNSLILTGRSLISKI